ncbi:MAG: leucine-rich repeat protein [Bacteroides sp.]|nr:leucine-rich repeat protein [Bacteroides sp.]MCM1389368.1 leucine-rich repeat protein [Bacteroides sp.]
MSTTKHNTAMYNLSNLRVNSVWYRLIILLILICSDYQCLAQNINRFDKINGVIYHTYTYPDVDWHDRGYGEVVATKYTGESSFVIVEPTLEFDMPDINSTAGVHESQTFPVVEIADQFCNMTNSFDGGYVKCPLTGLGIPKHIKRIGVDAFAGCTKLTGIDFQSMSLEIIADRAFKGCAGIKSMNISSCRKLRSIGNEAFYNCSNLTAVYIPESVQEIGSSAFANCTELSHVSLPNAIERINAGTFFGCKNLRSIPLTNGLKEIRGQAFALSGIAGILFFPSGLKEILYDAFHSCENLQGSLNFPDSVIEIGSRAFMNCPNISGSLTFGKNVKIIGDDAFKNIGQIDVVIVNAQNPPKGYKFPDIIYQNAVLYVPIGTASEYAQANIWKDFTVIKEVEYQQPEKLEVTIGKRTVTSYDYGDNLIVVESGTKIPIHSAVTPNNLVTEQVFWNSSDTLVCKINDGYLEMKGGGSATLTAWTCNNLSVKLKIEEGTPIYKIELPDTIDIELGKTSFIHYTALPEGKHPAKFNCEISNPSIAKISSSSGQIEGVNLGTTMLAVTAGDGWGASDTCIVRVIPPHVTDISITNSRNPASKDITYSIKDSRPPLQLKANVSPYNAIQDVIWTSSNENIATVDSNGLVTFKGYGNVRVRATSVENKKIYDECKITLEYKTSVLLNGQNVSLRLYKDDEEGKFTFQYEPSTLPITDVSFSSANDNIFTVDSVGNATWVGEGMTSVFCTYKLYDETYRISQYVFCEPSRYITHLSFKQASIDVIDGNQFQIDLNDLVISPEDAMYKGLEWSVSDETIVSITQCSKDYAIFQTNTVGETKIIAKAKEGTAQAECRVIVRPLLISSITLSDNQIWLYVGRQTLLAAYFEPYFASNSKLLWYSCDEKIARISEIDSYSGSNICAIEAIGAGETDIIVKAEDGEAMAKCHVFVDPIKVSEITLNKNYINGYEGDEFQLEAKVYPEDATDNTVKWRSKDSNIVSVDDFGKIQLKKVGDTYIYAYPADGTDTYASCYVVVRENTSGVLESIKADENSRVKIYDTHGFLIYDGLYSDAKLESGYYVILYDGKSIRVKIESAK